MQLFRFIVKAVSGRMTHGVCTTPVRQCAWTSSAASLRPFNPACDSLSISSSAELAGDGVHRGCAQLAQHRPGAYQSGFQSP